MNREGVGEKTRLRIQYEQSRTFYFYVDCNVKLSGLRAAQTRSALVLVTLSIIHCVKQRELYLLENQFLQIAALPRARAPRPC